MKEGTKYGGKKKVEKKRTLCLAYNYKTTKTKKNAKSNRLQPVYQQTILLSDSRIPIGDTISLQFVLRPCRYFLCCIDMSFSLSSPLCFSLQVIFREFVIFAVILFILSIGIRFVKFCIIPTYTYV